MPHSPLRVLVAEDEPLARELVRQYAQRQSGLTIVRECASGDELADGLSASRPDVALLDIQMPGANVFDVLLAATEAGLAMPTVVFATAYDEYAARAFDINAIDYLVKPFTEARFAEAMRRARERRDVGRPEEAIARVARDLGSRPDRLLVPNGSHMVAIAIDEIAWIGAEGDYARIHTMSRTVLVHRSLKEFQQRLDPTRFLRIHRSAIVRTDGILDVQPKGSSRFQIRLQDGTTLIVSRTHSPELRRWML